MKPLSRIDIGAAAALGMAPILPFAAFAAMAPLAAYTVALAFFGLPHVLSELRYVDRRFGRRLPPALLAQIAALLCVIVAARACVLFGAAPASVGAPVELGSGALLALLCARGGCARGGGGARKAVALSVAGAIGGATMIAPFTTSVAVAILHNFTPLGFLWQIAPRGERPRVMAAAGFGLLLLPLLAAMGAAHWALGAGPSPFDPLGAGPLAEHLGVYVPRPFLDGPRAVDFFTASVIAQGAHYLGVIVILPWMLGRLDPGARGLVRWPRGVLFALFCAGVAGLALSGFFADFARARAYYGLFAAVHAWIEVPVLILALTGGVSGESEVRGGARKFKPAPKRTLLRFGPWRAIWVYPQHGWSFLGTLAPDGARLRVHIRSSISARPCPRTKF
jgi:hypothetical protein